MQLNDITKFVNIKGFVIKNVEENEENIFLDGELSKKAKSCCLCNSKYIEVHDYRIQNIRDLPYRDKKVIIRFKRKRYKCRDCCKKFEIKPNFVSKKDQMTSRLKQSILFETGKVLTIKDISKKYHVSEFTVRRMIKLISPKRLEFGEVLNIDEFKGDCDNIKYQTIISDSKNQKIIDILPTRFEKDLIEYFSKIPEEERNRVKVFVSDMSRTFKMIHDKFFPKSIHVIDRYHFIRQVLWGFENVRKQQQNTMKKTNRIYFKRSKSLLTKPFSKLNNNEDITKVSLMLEINEKIKDAYLIKESFYNYVLKTDNSINSRVKLKAWIEHIKLKGLESFNACIRAFTNWFDPICNSFDFKHTNGYVEGHNNKTKVLKRIGYGYRNFDVFRTRRLLMG